MKTLLLFLFSLVCYTAFSQFDIEKYNEYLESHKNMTYEELIKEYPAGFFNDKAPSDFLNSEYGKEISEKFNISDYEKNLINTNGFMVTDRLKYPTFIHALWDIFKKDLPVYISTDAIFQAMHYSYNKVLIEYEERLLRFKLKSALNKLNDEIKKISLEGKPQKYVQALKDIDIYISIPKFLLNDFENLNFPENQVKFDNIIKLIREEVFVDDTLFSSSFKGVDYSQFTLRGHYTLKKSLSNYFQAMMWLGRTELMISNIKNTTKYLQTEEDLQRMALMTSLIAELSEKSNAVEDFNVIEKVMETLIGKQDNISLNEVIDVLNKNELTTEKICDSLTWKIFQGELIKLSSANQLYSSQVLYANPMEPSVVPPAVFLLIGQRPIIDGFITANVVYDKVKFEQKKILRMVPSTLDILFTIGNDACIQLMENEITKYKYASNLAGLRYLINSYNDDFWKSTVYNSWLNSIRVLNPPEKRKHLPLFMQTAAWWQKTMNTQLAAWAELRYNFLLYAKQPYTNSLVCSFPEAYIEPVPAFFESIKGVWKNIQKLDSFLNFDGFATRWINSMDTLKNLSNKILNNETFDKVDKAFICSTLKYGQICDPNSKAIDMGWYLQLYYGLDAGNFGMNYIGNFDNANVDGDKMIVTDVHTIPMNEYLENVGWVLHAGTGPVNLSVITTPTPDGKERSYIGPVFSYYEFISNDFKRLTNEEWRNMKDELPYRPKFTNLYLANSEGNKPEGDKVSLKTMILDVKEQIKDIDIKLNSMPNPFSNFTLINFSIDSDLADLESEITIFDLSGKIVTNLFKGKFVPNNYSILWDGTDNYKNQVISGTYIATIKIADKIYSTKINLRK